MKQIPLSIICMTFAVCFAHNISAQEPKLGTPKYDKRTAEGLTEAQAAYNDGLARQAANDLDGAIAAYTRSLTLDPYNPEARNNRGKARLDRGDAKGAIEDFTESIRFSPDAYEGYYNRGTARLDAGEHAGAITDFTRSLELKPDDSQALHNRGIAQRALKRTREAIADYTRAIEITPAPDYIYNRAVAYEETDDLAAALADYARVIELNPDYAQAYANRGVILLRQGKDAPADADFAVAFRLDPNLRQSLESYIKGMRAARPARKR